MENGARRGVGGVLMDLTPRERLIYNRLVHVFSPYLDSVSRAILSHRDFDIANLPDELRAALITELQAYYIADSNAVQSRDRLPEYDPEVVSSAAATWARQHTFDLVRGLTDTTNKLIQDVVSTAQETPGMTLEDMTRLLTSAFGEQRAQSIAITETTRAAAAATNGLQQYYKEFDLDYERVWITMADELVCPVCGPLNGKYEWRWNDRFPDGPPAHPNCRCFTVLKLRSR